MATISAENLPLLILVIANLILAVAVLALSVKIRRLLKGEGAKDLGDTIRNFDSEIKKLVAFRADLEKYLAKAETRLRRSVQGIETVRFNPFQGTGEGGNQSFATSLVNENGDGVVISTIYSRERTSVFAKPVKNHKSEFNLTEEEKLSLDQAHRKLKDN